MNYRKEKLRKQSHLQLHKKNKILRNKFNQRGEKSVHWKLLDIKDEKKLKKTQINGKIFHAHGLEELALSKCPYYLKQSTDSVWTLSKSQGHFSQKQNKKL